MLPRMAVGRYLGFVSINASIAPGRSGMAWEGTEFGNREYCSCAFCLYRCGVQVSQVHECAVLTKACGSDEGHKKDASFIALA